MSTHRLVPRRHARRPQLERRTPLRPQAAATAIVEALAEWLGEPPPRGYAAGLAHRARRVYAHSAAFRAKMHRRGDASRDLLHVFLQHWLADRLRRERPDLFRRLPAGYATGAALPPGTTGGGGSREPAHGGGGGDRYLSPEEHLMSAW